ncbi:unnamed protein product [Peronospora belbahrii]|uniref:RxLR effector protein n=2 Tax=Peronospora belbahrii TaxID=622444 RepID=A0ABN8CP48_9STRA|nr:unnamed protein product [Peronospora belbahrii]
MMRNRICTVFVAIGVWLLIANADAEPFNFTTPLLLGGQTEGSHSSYVKAYDKESEERSFPNLADIVLAAKLTPAVKDRIDLWLRKVTTPVKVLTNLKLQNEHLLSNPEFAKFLEYLMRYNQKFSYHKPVRVLDCLKASFPEEMLKKMMSLDNINKDTHAWRMLVSDLNDRVEPKELFVKLELPMVTGNLLGDELFKYWHMYMKLYNIENSGRQTTVFRVVEDTCPGRMDKIILDGLSDPSTKQTAELLRQLKEGAPPKIALEKVSSEIAKQLIQGNPLLGEWVNYVQRFNERYPISKMTRTEVIEKYYKDNGLASVIEAADWKRVNPQRKDQQKFLATMTSPDTVFTTWHLDKKRLSLFRNDIILHWMDYVDAYKIEHSEEAENFILKLLPYKGDKELLDALYSSSLDSYRMGKASRRVFDELTRSWLDTQKTPQEVLPILTNTVEGNPFLAPAFTEWMRYVAAFNTRYPANRQLPLTIFLETYYLPDIMTHLKVSKHNFYMDKFVTELDQALKTFQTTAQNHDSRAEIDLYLKMIHEWRHPPKISNESTKRKRETVP